jgi:hypothetical protein
MTELNNKKRQELRMNFEEAWAILEILDIWTEDWPNDPIINRVHRRLERMLVSKKPRRAA